MLRERRKAVQFTITRLFAVVAAVISMLTLSMATAAGQDLKSRDPTLARSRPMTFQQARRELLASLAEHSCYQLYDTQIDADSLQVSPVHIGKRTVGSIRIRFDDIKKSKIYDGDCGMFVTLELRSRNPSKFFSFSFDDKEVANHFASALNWFVSHEEEARSEEMAAKQFKTQAAQWRVLSVKPGMPENAREHKVLAENAVQEKNFDKAIHEYEAALDIFPMWPEGQFNVAVLCGETANYDCAVEHLQNYLELVPDAPNAQDAKDKLIIWRDKLAHPWQAEPK